MPGGTDSVIDGANALSLVNTFVGMAIDIETRTPRISNVTAGLSSPGSNPWRFSCCEWVVSGENSQRARKQAFDRLDRKPMFLAPGQVARSQSKPFASDITLQQWYAFVYTLVNNAYSSLQSTPHSSKTWQSPSKSFVFKDRIKGV